MDKRFLKSKFKGYKKRPEDIQPFLFNASYIVAIFVALFE